MGGAALSGAVSVHNPLGRPCLHCLTKKPPRCLEASYPSKAPVYTQFCDNCHKISLQGLGVFDKNSTVFIAAFKIKMLTVKGTAKKGNEDACKSTLNNFEDEGQPKKGTANNALLALPTILVVYENPIFRRTIRSLLEPDGIHVLEAIDPLVALHLIEDKMKHDSTIDLLLLDEFSVYIPDTEGDTVIRRCRNMGFKGKVYVATSLAFVHDVASYFAIDGLDGILMKPYDHQMLLDTILDCAK